MATKVFTGSDLVFDVAFSDQDEFVAVAAAWPSSMNGDSGTVNCTTFYGTGTRMLTLIGALFDDGSVPADITMTGVLVEFDWNITNGAKAGGVTGSTLTDSIVTDTQAQGSFSGHWSDAPTPTDWFGGTARANLFTDPSIGWSYFGTFTGAFASHSRRVAVSNYTVTVTYDVPIAATVTSVIPASGSVAGGQHVTIRGTGLLSGSGVEFGGIAATSFVIVNDTTVTAVTPSHLTGVVDVEVLGAAVGDDLYTFVVETLRLPQMPVNTPIFQGGGNPKGQR